jgi:hypothetical protein
MKRGKSWWLMELGYLAYRQRKSVAYFQAGDLSLGQIWRRLCIRQSGRNNRRDFCGQRVSPVFDCKLNQVGQCSRDDRTGSGSCPMSVIKCRPKATELSRMDDYTPCSACRGKDDSEWEPALWYELVSVLPLDGQIAVESKKSLLAWTKGIRFKLSVHPNKTLHVKEIDTILDIWEQAEGFVPDVIVVDYADILAPENSKEQFRHQQNETWSSLRSLSQRKHCLVITATQADADGLTKESLGLDNFSEDVRKYAHVTGMFTLNRTDLEKNLRIMRLSELIGRDTDTDLADNVTVLWHLDRGRILLDSVLGRISLGSVGKESKEEDE